MNSTFLKLSALSLALISAGVQADLVLKRGQVIGRDGEIYDGMTPETREVLEAQAEDGILKSGVVNGNFYMILDGVVTTVPLTTLRSLDSEERMELVKESFSEDAREALKDEYRNQLASEMENHRDEMDREVERHMDEIDDEMEREIEDHMDELEHEMGLEIEDHMDELEHEIEREVESHMDEIEHEIENHSREIEREVEHHSEGHDDDHDDHEDDD
jgi:hypothetical protein